MTLSARTRALVEIAIVALATLVGVALLVGRARTEPIGATVDLEFTLQPRDAASLACAGDLHVSHGGVEHRCAFDAHRKLRRGVTRRLQPVVSRGHRVVVLGGVFDVPAIRDAPERRKGVTTFRCRAVVLLHAPRLDVRFADDGNWDSRRNVIVAAPQSCALVP